MRDLLIAGVVVLVGVTLLGGRESGSDVISDPRTYGGGNPFENAETTGTTPLGTSATRGELRENARDLINDSTIQRLRELGGSRAGGGPV